MVSYLPCILGVSTRKGILVPISNNTIKTPTVRVDGVLTHVHKKADNTPSPNARPLGGFGAPPSAAPASSASFVPSTFEELSVPWKEDFDEAWASVRVEFSNEHFPNGEYSWNTVMGSNTRMTEGNERQYAEIIEAAMRKDPKWVARVDKRAAQYADAKKYGRAYRLDIPIDEDSEAYFEEVWNDPNHNFGRAQLEIQLKRLEANRIGLEEGTVKPSQIIGGGVKNPKKVAREWLRARYEETREGLETRGRSIGVLGNNADYRKRLREQGTPTIATEEKG